MYKIAICLTTFLREKLLKDCINSIKEHWQDNYTLFVASYGDKNQEVLEFVKAQITNSFGYSLPFDSGLGVARNFLVKKAKERNFKYCLITADSLFFNKTYNFDSIVDFLESDPTYGIVGLNIKNRINWECDLKLIKNKHFELDIPRKAPIYFKNIRFQPLDIVRNFFIAKTDCLYSTMWDDNLKLGEHEDFFYRLKPNYKVFSTDIIDCNYVDYKPSDYLKFRNRLYSDFMPILKKKYEIANWVNYTSDLRNSFRNYRR